MSKARMTIRFDVQDSRCNEELDSAGHRESTPPLKLVDTRRESPVGDPEQAADPGAFFPPEKFKNGSDELLPRGPEMVEWLPDIPGIEPENLTSLSDNPEKVESVELQDYSSYYRPRRPGSAWKLAGSVTAAVLTGLLFGSIVLNIFNGEGAEEDFQPGLPDILEEASGQPDNPITGAIDKEKSAPAAAGAGISVTIPEQTYYMLQYGVFSSAERAEQAKGELDEAGLAAFSDMSGENRVYAGVSPDREQAKLLSGQLKNEGVELYVREVTVPGAQSALFAGDGALLDIFFEASGGLAEQLSSLSASLLGKGQPEAVSESAMKNLTALHLQWTKAIKLIYPGLGPEAELALKNMENSMNNSVTALTEYNKNRSKGHLWEIQAGIMDYIMSQRKLVESL